MKKVEIMLVIIAIVLNSCAVTKQISTAKIAPYRVVRLSGIDKDGTKHILYQTKIR